MDRKRTARVLDTSVLLESFDAVISMEEVDLYIPIVVLEELDNLKRRDGNVGFQAREAVRKLGKIFEGHGRTPLDEGLALKENSRLFVTELAKDELPNGVFDVGKNDNYILACARKIEKEHEHESVVLLSKDACLKLKAESMAFRTEECEEPTPLELYDGYIHMKLERRKKERFSKLSHQVIETSGLYPNQFVVLGSKRNEKRTFPARFDGEKLRPLRYYKTPAWGVSPINLEQRMAFELLMDPDISLVTLAGGAGSGKTMLATAVALEKVIRQREYRKIVLVRSVIPAGKDIGYLPGSEDRKLRPWMGCFFDAIEQIFSSDGGRKKEKKAKSMEVTSKVENFVLEMRNKGMLETCTFAYMRGRTLANVFVIVDEAQETTPHLAKLMLTRCGSDSKFVFLGDPSDNQIDNVLVDSRSNGLVYLIEKMKHHGITGHVTLKKVERSPLAALAEAVL